LHYDCNRVNFGCTQLQLDPLCFILECSVAHCMRLNMSFQLNMEITRSLSYTYICWSIVFTRGKRGMIYARPTYQTLESNSTVSDLDHTLQRTNEYFL
jgi:hypothetical protein